MLLSLTFPWGKVARRAGRGAEQTRYRKPPHTRQGYALPPSPRRGFYSLTFPWGKVAPQGRKRGGTRSDLQAAPHPSGLRPATLSQERVLPL